MAKEMDPATRAMIGCNLAKARAMAGLSQAQVMNKVFGTTNSKQKNRISEMENGKSLPDAELLSQLCKLYGISSDYILGHSAEAVLDINVGRASLIYTSIHEIMSDSIQNITEQLCAVGVRHLNTLPRSSVLALLHAVKDFVSTHNVKNNDPNIQKIIEMSNIVRECEVQIAISERDMQHALDDIANIEEKEHRQTLVVDITEKRNSRFRSMSLPKIDSKKPQRQLNFFEE